MPREKINWFLDVAEYRKVAKDRKALREPGQGTDYTHERFRDVVNRVVSRIHPKRMNLRVVEILPQTATVVVAELNCDGPAEGAPSTLENSAGDESIGAPAG